MVTFLYIDKKVEMKKMNKKIVAILMVTLMSATMFAGMATVTAEEDEYLKEVKDHVTPEQWVEIEDLINNNEKSLLKADLTIKSFTKTGDDKLEATVKNIGDAWALPFSTLFKIYVDGTWESVGRDWVLSGLRVGYSVDTYSNVITDTGEIDCWAKVNPTENVPEITTKNNVATGTFTF